MDTVEPLTQFIFVDPVTPGDRLISAVADASASAYMTLGMTGLHTWEEWMSNDYRKSVRAIKKPSDFDFDVIVSLVRDDTGKPIAGATIPMRKSELPSRLRRAQVSGWDSKVLSWEGPVEGESYDGLLLLNDDLEMSTGKMAAQAAHAVMHFVALQHRMPSLRKNIQRVPYELLDEKGKYAVQDNGLTEVEPGSFTAEYRDLSGWR